MIEIVVLGEPVAKGRPRFDRTTGRAYTPEKTRSFEGALKYAAIQVMGNRPPLDGPLRVEIDVMLPIAKSWPKKQQAAARSGALRPTKRPDIDNFGKVIDSCNLVVWGDDSQIVEARLRKFYSDKPGLWIRVEPIEGVFA